MTTLQVATILFALAFFTLIGCRSQQPLSCAAAEKVAGKALEGYAKRAGLATADFEMPQESVCGSRPGRKRDAWYFHYALKKNPYDVVYVTVDAYGDASIDRKDAR